MQSYGGAAILSRAVGHNLTAVSANAQFSGSMAGSGPFCTTMSVSASVIIGSASQK